MCCSSKTHNQGAVNNVMTSLFRIFSKAYREDANLTKLSKKSTERWIAAEEVHSRIVPFRYAKVVPLGSEHTVPFRRAIVVDVYDGETLAVAAFIKNKPYQFICRLARIDVPEIRPPKDDMLDVHASEQCKLISKMALTHMALGHIVTLYEAKFEENDRILTDLVVDGTTERLSDRMLKCRIAIPYRTNNLKHCESTKTTWK